jgi:hypothetical protein
LERKRTGAARAWSSGAAGVSSQFTIQSSSGGQTPVYASGTRSTTTSQSPRDELDGVDPQKLTMHAVLERVERLGDVFEPVPRLRQRLPSRAI